MDEEIRQQRIDAVRRSQVMLDVALESLENLSEGVYDVLGQVAERLREDQYALAQELLRMGGE